MQVNSYCKRLSKLLLGSREEKSERTANEEKAQLSWLFE